MTIHTSSVVNGFGCTVSRLAEVQMVQSPPACSYASSREEPSPSANSTQSWKVADPAGADDMMICFDGPIQWRGNTYESGRLGVTDDGHFVLDLRSSGRYHTMIPISAHNYTQAAMRDDGECLTIFDNWGSVCRIAIPREAIKAVLAEAAAHEIPILTEHD